MNLFRLLQERAAEGRPVTVGLVGAGKFGSMVLAQARTTPGLRVAAVADLDPQAEDLEGYLFPETYHVPRGTSAEEITRLMVGRFRKVAASLPRHSH